MWLRHNKAIVVEVNLHDPTNEGFHGGSPSSLVGLYWKIRNKHLFSGFSLPLWKMMDFVSWDYYLPICEMENQPNIPKHQAEMDDDWDDDSGVSLFQETSAWRSQLWATNPISQPTQYQPCFSREWNHRAIFELLYIWLYIYDYIYMIIYIWFNVSFYLWL